MDAPKSPLIQALIDERKLQGLTQAQLSDLSGVSRRAINLIEAGGNCTLETLQRLYEATGLEASARRSRLTLDEVVQETDAELFGKPLAPGG